MQNLQDLYQQMIIDHSQHPHNFCILSKATHQQEGYNPICGDKITLYLNVQDGKIVEVSFQGTGCAISTASASLLTDAIKNKTLDEVAALFNELQELVTTGKATHPEKLGKLAVLAGVTNFPMRVKCATLAWHTLKAALAQESGTVSTE